MNGKILVVDDDHNLLKVVSYQLNDAGYEVATASSVARALEIFKEGDIDLVLTDVRMPDMDGTKLLEKVHAAGPETPVIFMTAFAAIDSAVDAIKMGATDYIPKPFAREDLLNKVSRALEAGRLRKENESLKIELARKGGVEEMVGKSEAMRAVFDKLAQVAPSESTVLVQGESGTGKELLARAIHRLSPRSTGPMVAINCAAIPRDLLESELFGHVRGAFTGAVKDRVGVFKRADKGTLFLDEVGDINIDLQPKLLRVLQEREVVRVGASDPEKVNVRLVAATQADLKKMVAQGKFREDLFYRLNVIPIKLPPLRERKGDVPILAKHFLEKHFPKKNLYFSHDATMGLERYQWPGNVRELENAVERIGTLARVKTIYYGDLPEEIREGRMIPQLAPYPETLRDSERRAIVNALETTGGNRTAAARILGIPRHTLIYRMKKYKID